MLTGQLADKPTRGQSSRGLVNSRTSKLAVSDFLIMERLHYICTLNLSLTLTLTLLVISSVQLCNLPQIIIRAIYCKF